uniref:Uncharacterized protein n=1 Tax=Fusarium oxysporum (strain Fo5176) TaxID=660025 RepID=A0A0D2XXT2_FUSOF
MRLQRMSPLCPIERFHDKAGIWRGVVESVEDYSPCMFQSVFVCVRKASISPPMIISKGYFQVRSSKVPWRCPDIGCGLSWLRSDTNEAMIVDEPLFDLLWSSIFFVKVRHNLVIRAVIDKLEIRAVVIQTWLLGGARCRGTWGTSLGS